MAIKYTKYFEEVEIGEVFEFEKQLFMKISTNSAVLWFVGLTLDLALKELPAASDAVN